MREPESESHRQRGDSLQPVGTDRRSVEPAKQLDFAKDCVAQIIALSSAVLAISLTFSHNWAVDAPWANTTWLKASWLALIAAIVLGLWAMLALAGLAYSQTANVGRWSFRLPWLLEVVSFLLGLGFLLVFGWLTLKT